MPDHEPRTDAVSEAVEMTDDLACTMTHTGIHNKERQRGVYWKRWKAAFATVPLHAPHDQPPHVIRMWPVIRTRASQRGWEQLRDGDPHDLKLYATAESMVPVVWATLIDLFVAHMLACRDCRPDTWDWLTIPAAATSDDPPTAIPPNPREDPSP